MNKVRKAVSLAATGGMILAGGALAAPAATAAPGHGNAPKTVEAVAAQEAFSLSATSAGGDSYNLTWTAVPGATEYRVYTLEFVAYTDQVFTIPLDLEYFDGAATSGTVSYTPSGIYNDATDFYIQAKTPGGEWNVVSTPIPGR
ncbi:hypothetical protein [Haematomicrobium sanguinis]|uniref:hypothetical protein n=1 Tax=Haematomicrobium sanguinis TaxID=479106 RepID=UPI0004786CB7|nr:hypothetical protein [Haematomicrobium sanguinis]